jgi:hypothetical protein
MLLMVIGPTNAAFILHYGIAIVAYVDDFGHYLTL